MEKNKTVDINFELPDFHGKEPIQKEKNEEQINAVDKSKLTNEQKQSVETLPTKNVHKETEKNEEQNKTENKEEKKSEVLNVDDVLNFKEDQTFIPIKDEDEINQNAESFETIPLENESIEEIENTYNEKLKEKLLQHEITTKDGNTVKLGEVFEENIHYYFINSGQPNEKIALTDDAVSIIVRLTGASLSEPNYFDLPNGYNDKGYTVKLSASFPKTGEVKWATGVCNDINVGSDINKKHKPLAAEKRAEMRAVLRSSTVGLEWLYAASESEEFKREHSLIEENKRLKRNVESLQNALKKRFEENSSKTQQLKDTSRTSLQEKNNEIQRLQAQIESLKKENSEWKENTKKMEQHIREELKTEFEKALAESKLNLDHLSNHERDELLKQIHELGEKSAKIEKNNLQLLGMVAKFLNEKGLYQEFLARQHELVQTFFLTKISK